MDTFEFPPASASRSAPYQPGFAVLQGQFVEAAYSMYDADPTDLTPPPPANFPAGYRLAAWVQMQDFLIGSTGPTFYGFIAQSLANPRSFVLAIRGTSTWVEWWDDLNAIVLVPFKNPNWGKVGAGFARIYETLEVIAAPVSGAAAGRESLKSAGGFAQQVAAVTSRFAPPPLPQAAPSPPAIAVAGHSLGSALATLYVLDNAQSGGLAIASIYTFASPRVGDADFARAFDALGLTSWRIVNYLDLVPRVPLGFTHVAALQQYDSGLGVWPSPVCWHSLATYLSLIDPRLKPDPDCRWTLAAQAARGAPSAAKSLAVPAGPVTVNITVNVETAEER